MNSAQRLELARMLLRCPSVSNRSSRDAIVNDLPDEIQDKIPRAPADLTDVKNIIEACSNYENGTEQLISIIREYEGSSIPIKEVDRWLATVAQPSLSDGGKRGESATTVLDIP